MVYCDIPINAYVLAVLRSLPSLSITVTPNQVNPNSPSLPQLPPTPTDPSALSLISNYYCYLSSINIKP